MCQGNRSELFSPFPLVHAKSLTDQRTVTLSCHEARLMSESNRLVRPPWGRN